MKLTRLKTKGLKARDLDLQLNAVNVIVGPNTAGKSTFILALYLLVFGKTKSPSKTTALDSGATISDTGDGILLLSRYDSIEIEAVWEGEGRTMRAKRSWSRDRKKKVSEIVELSGFDCYLTGTDRERALALQQAMGGSLEVWHPADLGGLSAAKLRDRLLRAIPQHEMRLEDWTPEGLPPWAQPASEQEHPLDWITTAIARTKNKISEEQSERRALESQVESVEDAWRGEESSEEQRRRLVELRAESENAWARKEAQKRVDEVRRKLERARSKYNPDAIPMAPAIRLFAGLARAGVAAARQAADEVWPAANTLERELADARMLLRQKADVEDASEADVEAAHQDVKDREEEANVLRSSRSSLEGRLSALSGECPLAECPECRASLSTHWEAAAEQAQSDFDRVRKDLVHAHDKVAAARERLEQAVAGAAKASAREEVRRLEAAMDAAREECEALPGKADLRSAEARADLLVSRLAEVEEAARTVSDLEYDLEIAEADMEELPAARAQAEVDAEIEAVEAEIEAIGARNARAQQLVEAKEGLEVVGQLLEDLDGWKKRFEGIQARMVDACRGWLETRLSATTGAPVEVQLVDERDKPTCRLTIDGKPSVTLSGGEMALWLVANVLTFSEASRAVWKPLVKDGLEVVSADRRGAFLEAVVAAQADSQVDQVFLAGCPDTLPDVQGVHVIDLGQTDEKARAVGV